MKQLALWNMVLITLLATNGWARQESLTAEEKHKLEQIDRVLVEVIALSDKRPGDAGAFTDVVTKRMKEFGYTVVTDPAQPHDATLSVKCEQRKIWEGTTKMGSDADLPDSPSRLWKGPACQLSYVLDGKKMPWRKEVRTDFADAQQAAEAAKAGDPSDYAMSKLKERLEEYDFPALITAEWGQEDRLFKVYDDPATSSARKVRLITLFGYLFETKAVPRLLAGLKDSDIEIAK
ncbi:MAG TPA: HEAT repeat domain-containing protein, partial [Nitrospira sp.]|nr:HEAT repeat domain-containing protein [Nitrospira sp.]